MQLVTNRGMLLPRDEMRLAGVHPDLVRVVRRARLALSFIVCEGLRTPERQAQLVAEGKSRTLRSRHLTGHAVDLAAWDDVNSDGIVQAGEIPWSQWGRFAAIAGAMKAAAAVEAVPVEWGGDWRGFPDGPHFQLPWESYPAQDG